MSAPVAPPSQDAYAPNEIARRVREVGVTKARAGAMTLFVLAVLAGAFIALGGAAYLVVVTGSSLGFGPTRLLGGLAFAVGLVLVVVGGAELFTGNNLLGMAWAARLVTGREVLRNWGIVYAGNVVGAVGTAGLVALADFGSLGGGAVGETIGGVAATKCLLSPTAAFARGVLCNALVCLAVWLSFACRSVTDKILAVLLPIAAFVLAGFEHSIANWFFLPLAACTVDVPYDLPRAAAANLLWVTLGNTVGGTGLVAVVYWFAYLRGQPKDTA